MDDLIKGRLGGADGYDIRCTIDGDTISGRAGGKLHGKDIDLEITERGVQGTVGNDPVKIELDGGELKGNVGSQKLVLRGVDRVTGFMGEPIVGWNVVAQQTGERLTGQLGSTVLGRPFELELGSAPGWVGTLVALVAFYALEPRASVTVSR
ncbi:hypothetical protein QR90_05940 [Deinococcus radiopugnans]|uniref:Uncharacterized protein n=2 Tax=Deinococcus radiopugnans TaxID=57497 RepID=A0A0A7KJI9_9DEIO|nr:hypothetical protein [Deinococcus radiopugnans]AIZ44738.1 hypothetical protein QR90_05940 [Deinococcus radiopugnans]MBB6015090.1 hypothetical protein [Deinococcus radiopugnans ATCC 19172]QLG10362.1 hypothetical protein HLB42_05930 [Deinococcus sp. D7000]TNM70938.1 hypothetical protein FHR04_10690 [Deinococcus radiopugnans ATCC 19172]